MGFVPLSKTGAELLLERYERGATLITSNLLFDEGRSLRLQLTGALLDRLTHHMNIRAMNGDSYRLTESRTRKIEAEA